MTEDKNYDNLDSTSNEKIENKDVLLSPEIINILRDRSTTKPSEDSTKMVLQMAKQKLDSLTSIKNADSKIVYPESILQKFNKMFIKWSFAAGIMVIFIFVFGIWYLENNNKSDKLNIPDKSAISYPVKNGNDIYLQEVDNSLATARDGIERAIPWGKINQII